mmetsp:Transcript_37869/g.56685  ORF Transcript_37869/g.56685 Transcript_37869/m.56685 type:complete len:270 (-) Transcript_37869:561-1370(-)
MNFRATIVLCILTIISAFSVPNSHYLASRMTSSTDNGPLEIYYFHLFAKVGSLFALEHSGLSYVHKKPEDWKAMKAELSWGCLPILKNLPAEDAAAFGGAELGQELAIMNYIANRVPEKMKGANLSEELVSQQLYGEAEDIYQALARIKTKLVTGEAAVNFWSKDNIDPLSHNRQFGIYVFLDKLEKFIQKCGKAQDGKFTTSGVTVGECKLFATLCACKKIEDSLLQDFEGLKRFYDRFEKEPATQVILSGAKTDGVLPQYFLKPDEM